MPSEILNKARAYEAEHGAAISPAERPAYHMTPYVGWLNDPNGFSYYKGKGSLGISTYTPKAGEDWSHLFK